MELETEEAFCFFNIKISVNDESRLNLIYFYEVS